MESQLSFEGLEVPALGGLLFFAILFGARDSRRLFACGEGVRRDYHLQGLSIAPGRLHVSLHPVWKYVGIPKPLVATATQAAMTLNVIAFDLTFDRVMSFDIGRDRRALVLRSCNDAALRALYRDLGVAMRDAGLGGIRSRFTPHVTLLYDNVAVKERAVAPMTCRIDELTLIHSDSQRHRHTHLARWPLPG